MSYYGIIAAFTAAVIVLILGLVGGTPDVAATSLFVFFFVWGLFLFVHNEWKRWRNGR